MALLGAALLLGRAPFWWLGMALLAAGAVLLESRLRELWDRAAGRVALGQRKAVVEVLCLALLAVVAFAAIPKVAGGDRPTSKDHTAHYLRSHETRHHFLPQWQVQGWSHRLFAGYPSGYNYPIGSDLWVAAVHLAALGALDFSQAYAVAFFLSFLLLGYGVYRLGERFFGRGAGLLAGLLYLTDPGIIGFGWDAFEWGVWPQRLAMALALLALAGLPAVVRERRMGAVAVFGLLMGAAVVVHPVVLLLQLVALGVTLAVWLRRVDSEEAEAGQQLAAGRALVRLLLANGLGLMVSAFWLLPFIDARRYADVIGRAGLPMLELGRGLLTLDLIEGTWGVVLLLAVMGLVRTFRGGDVGARFVAWLSLVLFFAGSGALLLALNLPDHLPAVRAVQFERLSLLAKPFLFVLAAHTGLWLARQLWQRAPKVPRGPVARRAVVAGLLTLICFPVLISFAVGYYSQHVGRNAKLLSRRADQQDRAALGAYINARPRQGPLERVAFIGGRDDHSILDLATRLNRSFYKSGYTPGINFKYLIHSNQPGALAALNTRWVMSRQRLEEDDYQLVRRFGRYFLYRHQGFTPEPFAILEGKGPVELTRFSHQEIVLEAGPGAHGAMQLNVSYFPRWKLTRDGQPMEIRVQRHAASPLSSGFMAADLAPGVYRFVFQPSALDRVANWITLAGLLLACLLLLADLERGAAAPPVRMVERLAPRAGALLGWRGLMPAGAALTAAALGGALWLSARAPGIEIEGTRRVKEVRYDFLHNLPGASVWRLDDRLPPARCTWRLDRFSCGDSPHMVLRPRYTLHFVRCIEADLQRTDGLSLTFNDVPAGDGIFGYFVCHRGAGKLSLMVNGQQGPSFKCEAVGAVQPFFHPVPWPESGRHKSVSFIITQKKKKKLGRFCFQAQSVVRSVEMVPKPE